MLERLDKLLADAGIGSRSYVKRLIRKGLVCVDGIGATDPGEKADPATQLITCQGQRIGVNAPFWVMLHKPAGYITAVKDPVHPTVMSLLNLDPHRRLKVNPVGRLDLDTEGLLLFTEDGAAAHRLLSPAHHVPKTYQLVAAGRISQEMIARLQDGVVLGETKTRPAKVTVLEETALATFMELTITEGKYHQVKRMLKAVGSEVLYLRRTAMGGVSLDLSLTKGAHRMLGEEERNRLLQAGESSAIIGKQQKTQKIQKTQAAINRV